MNEGKPLYDQLGFYAEEHRMELEKPLSEDGENGDTANAVDWTEYVKVSEFLATHNVRNCLHPATSTKENKLEGTETGVIERSGYTPEHREAVRRAIDDAYGEDEGDLQDAPSEVDLENAHVCLRILGPVGADAEVALSRAARKETTEKGALKVNRSNLGKILVAEAVAALGGKAESTILLYASMLEEHGFLESAVTIRRKVKDEADKKLPHLDESAFTGIRTGLGENI